MRLLVRVLKVSHSKAISLLSSNRQTSRPFLSENWELKDLWTLKIHSFLDSMNARHRKRWLRCITNWCNSTVWYRTSTKTSISSASYTARGRPSRSRLARNQRCHLLEAVIRILAARVWTHRLGSLKLLLKNKDRMTEWSISTSRSCHRQICSSMSVIQILLETRNRLCRKEGASWASQYRMSMSGCWTLWKMVLQKISNKNHSHPTIHASLSSTIRTPMLSDSTNRSHLLEFWSSRFLSRAKFRNILPMPNKWM